MVSQEQIDALVAAMLVNAGGPASASNDAGSVTARSLNEQIEAIKFLANLRGVQNAKTRGLRMNALNPAGAVFGHAELEQMDQMHLQWLNRRFV